MSPIARTNEWFWSYESSKLACSGLRGRARGAFCAGAGAFKENINKFKQTLQQCFSTDHDFIKRFIDHYNIYARLQIFISHLFLLFSVGLRLFDLALMASLTSSEAEIWNIKKC